MCYRRRPTLPDLSNKISPIPLNDLIEQQGGRAVAFLSNLSKENRVGVLTSELIHEGVW